MGPENEVARHVVMYQVLCCFLFETAKLGSNYIVGCNLTFAKNRRSGARICSAAKILHIAVFQIFTKVRLHALC